MPSSLRPLLLCALALTITACPGETPTPKPAAESASTAKSPASTGASEDNAVSETDPKTPADDRAVSLDAGPDPHSYSRPDQVRVLHLGLNWAVDFDAQTLTGDAVLLLERSDPDAPLILDSRDLDVKAAFAATLDAAPGPQGAPELALDPVRQDAAWTETKWSFGAGDAGFGKPLIIELPEGVNAVKLSYATRPNATGLQWLDPAQTAGKKAPFLYSQSQAIHARSWIPTQDSPGVRATWDAVVVAPARFSVVMAADQLGPMEGSEEAGDRAFRFVMPQKVPGYLVALGVGDLERREVGARTAVWADPTVVAAAADEFVDMEKMLESAEGLYGEYAWGRYDVLVLPPAFPFGGMENPRLTFLTPTLLAGDRSLVAVLAHELAHSWSGNLVTNATWGDLWLNEGFTVYFERRIIEEIYGIERATIEAVIGKRELLEELEDPRALGGKPEFQKLAQDLRGVDPDESFSGVPYEKGAMLLVSLEQVYGREVFDAFLRKWFTSNAFGSVSTPDFRAFAKRELFDAHPLPEGKQAPVLDDWLDKPGLPDTAPEPASGELDEVAIDAGRFAAGEVAAKALKTKSWTAWHWLHFLRSLPEPSVEQMGELDAAFQLSKSGNAEILGEWLEMAARHRYEPAYARMESFLIEVGRRKFLTPIYRALVETPEGQTQAKQIFAKAKAGYHAISRRTISGIVRPR